MCLNPKWIYKKGNYKKSNYRGQEGELYELGTYSKCGSCEQCQNEKSNNWVIRNYYEAKAWNNIAFITLTYTENPILLYKKDFQNFMKRLRINLKRNGFKEKIRMFMVGEYGTISNRPHGHYIIYNWKDYEKKYIGVNNKGNIIYKSQLIEKTWGLGITSYQEFEIHEIPYISLYETPEETFKKAYKLNKEKANKIKEIYRNTIKDPKRAKELRKMLNEELKEMKKNKEKWRAIKEFNSWSTALGWEEYYKDFLKNSEKNDFNVYIEDKIFKVPSQWVKKLANMGYISAINEMFKREEEIKQSYNEKEERRKNKQKLLSKKTKEKTEWIDKKDKIEFI